MKKYSILLLLAALSGCSLLPPEMLSREFIAEDIKGEAIPAGLNNKTIVYGRTELRFTNGYVSLKGGSYDTYAARIVKIDTATAAHYKLFISDGSKEKGKLRVNALYVTNANNNIYGYGSSNSVDIDGAFPEVFPPSSTGDSMGKIYLEWAVDEAHKPAPLPGSYQGTYRNVGSMYGPTSYKVSATGITQVYSYGSNSEEKFLRVVGSVTEYTCYTANNAYKITANDIFIGSPMPGTRYNPAVNATFGPTPNATK